MYPASSTWGASRRSTAHPTSGISRNWVVDAPTISHRAACVPTPVFCGIHCSWKALPVYPNMGMAANAPMKTAMWSVRLRIVALVRPSAVGSCCRCCASRNSWVSGSAWACAHHRKGAGGGGAGDGLHQQSRSPQPRPSPAGHDWCQLTSMSGLKVCRTDDSLERRPETSASDRLRVDFGARPGTGGGGVQRAGCTTAVWMAGRITELTEQHSSDYHPGLEARRRVHMKLPALCLPIHRT